MSRFRRRRFLAAASMLPLALLAARAQGAKTPRIGVLWPLSDNDTLDAFRLGLRDVGLVEGRNVLVEYRFAHGKDELLPRLAAELVALEVDVLVTYGVTAARVAMRASASIPIVNGSMSDPVAAGLVASLAKPGGNLTGLTSRSPELASKRLELIRELVPGVTRVGVLTTAGRTAGLALEETERAARLLGLAMHVAQVRGAEELANAFAAAVSAGAGALLVLPDLMFNEHRGKIVALAAEHRLPAAYYSREFPDSGGLMSYASSFGDQFRRAAVYVDRILKGAKPGDLPIEAPAKFELVINLKASKAIGLAIPRSILLRADKVIE